MKKKLISIIIIFLIIINSNRFTEKIFSNNNIINLEEKIIKKVKLRTERDLKRLGVVKILLSENGIWSQVPGYLFKFKKDGRIYVDYKLSKLGYCYWKVKNGKLLINPNNIEDILKENKFYEMIVEASDENSYSTTSLSFYKYALKIRSKNDKINLGINLFSDKKINVE